MPYAMLSVMKYFMFVLYYLIKQKFEKEISKIEKKANKIFFKKKYIKKERKRKRISSLFKMFSELTRGILIWDKLKI